MSSDSSHSFVIINERDNILISQSLISKLASESSGNKNNKSSSDSSAPASPSADSQENGGMKASEMMRRPLDGYSNYLPSDSHPSQQPQFNGSDASQADMPFTMNPEYVAKHVQFDSSTNLYALRGEYEHKLQQYQHAWRSRMEEMERINAQLFKLNSEKFAAEVDRVNQKFFKDHSAYEVPCSSQESRILNCYKLNPKKPLLCADEVRKFAECIDKSRLNLLKR